MAADHALRRELSRRIRDDLIRLGLVQAGPAVRIADGAAASAGDLIVCTRNDHTVEAGEPGRTLANGDLLRIDAITAGGPARPPRPGRRPGDRAAPLDRPHSSCTRTTPNAELGYAVTDHAAQGRTVHTGLAVITGTEDRQHAYVALTRGTDANIAYVFTLSPKLADPAPGPRPAPDWPATTASPPSAERRARRRGGRDQGRARRAGRRAGPGRPAALGVPDPAAGPGRRRPPGHPARDLDRRDHPGPRAALPGPAA